MNVIEIARKMETDAIAFYSQAAEKTQCAAGEKMFETIAQDEKGHLEIVNNLLKGLDIHVEDVHPIQNVKTVFEAMKDDMMEKVEATPDDLEAFKIAMEMEKIRVRLHQDFIKPSSVFKMGILRIPLVGQKSLNNLNPTV